MKSKLAITITILASITVTACGGSTNSTSKTTKTIKVASTTSNKVTVVSTEYAFAPRTLVAKPGKFTVTLDNKGSIPHEFILLKTDKASGALKASGSAKVSEKNSVGEVSEIAGGKSKTSTFNLKAGKYVFVCNVPGHYGDGMRGTLTVK